MNTSDFRSRTTVTISLADLDDLRKNVEALQARVRELEAQLVEAKMSDPAGTIKLLRTIIDYALPIVQFATGNLEPSTVRGWPHGALASFADSVVQMPDATDHLRELAQDLRSFAQVAAGYEAFRRERDAHRIAMPATLEDFGPKTEEAARIHAQRGLDISARIRAAEGLDDDNGPGRNRT